MYKFIKKIIRKILSYYKIFYLKFINKRLSSFYLKKILPDFFINTLLNKPKVLNFMVNDICNSRCVMCNVWEKKLDREITPREIKEILSQPFFSSLEYIGISGGEPTLRKDLTQIYDTIISVLPNIKGIGLITNAIRAENIIETVVKINQLCVKRNVPFNVMVSLDGVGEVHDKVRGVIGNFESVIKVIRYLRDFTAIPISVGCTITKENLWHVDEVLDFCKEENIYVRFRIAEFINRLYNENLTNQIRSFNEKEKYQIALFFSKLLVTYENSPEVRETYKNIIEMLVGEGKRITKCPYQTDAIGLDSRGNLLFCSPKSPVLGSCINKSAKLIYFKNISTRRRIIKENCPNCIHDYHSAPTISSLNIEKERAKWVEALSVSSALKLSVEQPTKVIHDELQLQRPLIIGWYGTETAGDKAILADIIYRIKNKSPHAKITIASLYPFVTRYTVKELSLDDIEVIETYSKDYIEAVKNSDAVIMGGGPLMGMEPLGFVLAAFKIAVSNTIPTIIEGCGIGPLNEKKYFDVVKNIIDLSSVIKLRDLASVDWVLKNTNRKDVVYSGDPAEGFVKRWKSENTVDILNKDNTINCYIREITTEYIGTMSLDEFNSFKDRFEAELGVLIRYISEKLGLKVILLPMHTFVIGNDDRDFARNFVKKHLKSLDVEVCHKVYSPQDILRSMLHSKLSICMRFHSVLFAETLGIPYMAIDYTGGGKILNFLTDKNKQNLLIDRHQISQSLWSAKVENILDEYSYYSSSLD